MDKFPIGAIMNKGSEFCPSARPSSTGRSTCSRLLEHAAKGELDPSFLATHRFSLEDGPRGYAMFKHKEDGCVLVGIRAP